MTMQQRVGVGHAALVATMMTMMVMVLPTGVHAVDAKAAPLRVMFVGNSFTFVNELPQQLVNIAQSKGVTIEVNQSTIGGCTLYHQTAPGDETTAKLLQEDWDYIVLQDYSALPTVQAARTKYLDPAVRSFASQKKNAKIVMYLTWGYHDGNTAPCPSSDNAFCFPLGSLASLTNPPCATSSHYDDLAGNFSCMGYALARGYINERRTDGTGADMVAPCGLAWQVVRGVTEIPSGCKTIIDGQYASPFPLNLPFHVPGGVLPGFMLYRLLGNGSSIDKHPNVAGQYLNALTFFATLTGQSPIGAAPPLNTGSPSSGDKPLTSAQLLALQTAAEGVVKACGSACGL